jgi:hypothetical protein
MLAKMEANQETVDARIDANQEKMEAATHSIRSKLEETTRCQVEDVLSCVDQKTWGLHKELTEKMDETQLDL